MIFLERSQFDGRNEPLVVYHTGRLGMVRARSGGRVYASYCRIRMRGGGPCRRIAPLLVFTAGTYFGEQTDESRLMVAVLLVVACANPGWAQNDEPSFTLSSNQTYGSGDKPEVSVWAHNVKSLEFRLYRVHDSVKFFALLKDQHSFGGNGPRPAMSELSSRSSTPGSTVCGPGSATSSRTVHGWLTLEDSRMARGARGRARQPGGKTTPRCPS